MFLSALAFVTTVDPAHWLADLLAQAHASANLEEIRAVQTTVAGKQTTKIDYTITRQLPDRFALLVKDPATDPPKKWLFGQGQLIVLEPSTQKYMVRNLESSATLKSVVDEELTNIDAFARLLLLPDGMKDWADFIKSSPGWKVDPAKPVLTLKQSKVTGDIALDPKTHRLTRFTNTVNGTKTTWTVSYGRPSETEPFKLSPDAYQVTQFSDPKKLPKMDPATKALVTKLLRNYEPPASQAFRVKDDQGTTTVYYTRKGVYQKNNKVEFDYNGRQLNIKTSDGKTYTGPAKQEQLLSATSNLGTRVDPFLRDLIIGLNPVQRILESATTAKLAGNSTVNDDRCQVVQAKSDQLNLTFFVRQSDLFVVRITTSLPGDVNYKASRDFEKIKGAPTLPQVEAPASALPLTRLER